MARDGRRRDPALPVDRDADRQAGVGGADGQPHVAPIWFVVDDDADELEVVFNTGAETRQGPGDRAAIRACRCVVDDEHAAVRLRQADRAGRPSSEDPDELRTWATRIGGRYMGADRAEEFGRRNGVPGELLVRLRPTRVDRRGGLIAD